MLGEIKKNARKTKSFYSAYLGGILSALAISVFFFFTTKDNNFIYDWVLIMWGLGVSLFALGIFAVIGWCLQKDEISKRDFKLSYFVGVICSIIVISLILLKDKILSSFWCILITLIILFLIYFPSNWLYIKIWKERK